MTFLIVLSSYLFMGFIVAMIVRLVGLPALFHHESGESGHSKKLPDCNDVSSWDNPESSLRAVFKGEFLCKNDWSRPGKMNLKSLIGYLLFWPLNILAGCAMIGLLIIAILIVLITQSEKIEF